MSIDFLRSISGTAMPIQVEDGHDIQCVHVLRAAGLVEAVITYGDGASTKSSAVISSITYEGQAVLDRLRDNKPLA